MPLATLVQLGLGAAVSPDLLGRIATGQASVWLQRAAGHFTLSSRELACAARASVARAAGAIALGVTPPGRFGRLARWPGRTLAALVTREFADGIEPRYLIPFLADQGLTDNPAAVARLRHDIITACRAVSAGGGVTVIPDPATGDGDAALADLLRAARSPDLTVALVAQTRAVEPMPDLVAAFLGARDLLGDAVLHLFRETLRRDPRVRATVATLQREGIWAGVRDAAARSDATGSALAARLDAVAAALGPLPADLDAGFGALAESLDQLGATVVAEVQGIGVGIDALDRRMARIEALLAQSVPAHPARPLGPSPVAPDVAAVRPPTRRPSAAAAQPIDPHLRIELIRDPAESPNALAARLEGRPVLAGIARLDTRHFDPVAGRLPVAIDWLIDGVAGPAAGVIAVPAPELAPLVADGDERPLLARLDAGAPGGAVVAVGLVVLGLGETFALVPA